MQFTKVQIKYAVDGSLEDMYKFKSQIGTFMFNPQLNTIVQVYLTAVDESFSVLNDTDDSGNPVGSQKYSVWQEHGTPADFMRELLIIVRLLHDRKECITLAENEFKKLSLLKESA